MSRGEQVLFVALWAGLQLWQLSSGKALGAAGCRAASALLRQRGLLIPELTDSAP